MEHHDQLMSRRTMLVRSLQGAAALAALSALGAGAPVDPPPPLPPLPGAGWKQYPYVLFDNPTFTFPAIEGRTTNETDTWYVHGKLTGQDTGREYGFLTIFAKNRISGSLIKADFYTLAIFPLDTTEYGTYTSSDQGLNIGAPLLSSTAGYLNLRFASPLGPASWKTRVDGTNHMIPFAYDLDLVGVDAQRRPMALVATMDPQDEPTAPGPDPLPGIVAISGQEGTGTYFQTGIAFNGTITYAGVTEPVVGSSGHIDRQFFPRYAGVDSGQYSRDHGHEWGSIHLDDNSTLSLWLQYNRRERNAVEQFSGATRFFPSTAARDFAPELVVTPTSYVKWPSSVPNSFPGPSTNRYLLSAHIIDVPAWNLHLVGTPITAVPAHALPVEYMSGPVNYAGTVNGQPITGFGMAEHTAALYRRWELADVLGVTIANLPDDAFQPGGATREQLQLAADQVGTAYDSNDNATATQLVDTVIKPGIATLAAAHQPFLVELVADMIAAPAS